MIRNFDELLYLETNLDVKEAVAKGIYKNAYDHLEKYGLEEIKKGDRKFHPIFEPFSEEQYLELYSDIKAVVEKGLFKSGFEHFCKFGYEEIINEKRFWLKANKVSKDDVDNKKPIVTIVLGLPRSGLTLLTSLIGANSNITEWYLPFSTRKGLGIKEFVSIDVMKDEFKKAFPNDDYKENWIISESTADSENIQWLLRGLEELHNEAQVKVIWINRDINHTFLSLKDASKKYWGADFEKITEDDYTNYIHFAKNSYKNIIEVLLKFENRLVNFESLTKSTVDNLKELMNFIGISYEENQLDYMDKIHTNRIAGDPGFNDISTINAEVEERRKEEWNNYKNFDNALNEKDREFVQKYNNLVELEKSDVKTLNHYINHLLETNFDKNFYLSLYEDVKKTDIDPLEHFLNFGWKEKRWPKKGMENLNLIKREDAINPFVYYLLVDRFFEIQNQTNDNYEYPPIKLEIIDPETYELKEKLVVPRHDNPKVSIIIPAYNQHNYTLACIDSIIRNTNDVSYEIIIMDDNSPDPKAKEIEKDMENVIFVSNGINYGFLENCNKGARIAKGEYILFLNNDTNVQAKWLSSLVELIESDEKIGMVGSKLVYPNGQQQEAGGILWKDASAWNFGRLDTPSKPEFNYVKECDYISGASIMIKTDLWNEIGGFDTRYKPAYFEDSDLAFEVRNHGYKVLLQPKSIVVHFEGISHGTDTSSGIKSYQVANKEKFIDKWKDILEKENFENGQNVFLARDRSRFKPCILVVDHYLPHFDQDAGSRTVFAYLKFFVEKGFNVKFIGDNYYHYPESPQYLDKLTQMGVEVLWGNYYSNHWKDWMKENGNYINYVLLNRPHISTKYINAAKELTDAKILYYGHDLHFLRELREYELTKNNEKLNDVKVWKDIELSIMEKANISLYPSENEVKEITKISDINVRAIPAYIFENFDVKKRDISKTKDIIFVGGFGHKPNVDAVIWFVKEIFPLVQKELTDIKFYIIGSNPTDEIINLHDEKNIIVTGYVTDDELEKFYNEIRLVVAPLRYGAGIKGKIVEALYNQMPIVTTSIGAEGLENAEEYMKIVDDAYEFALEIIKLYKDEYLLQELSKKGIEYCKKYFSFNAVENKFQDIIPEVIKD